MKFGDLDVFVKTSKMGLRQIEGQDLRMHWGIDFSTREKDVDDKLKVKIFSLREGIVTAVNINSRDASGGLYVYVTTKLLTKYLTVRYYHFSRINVKLGDKINVGQFLGFMGNTGVNSTGPHLHVECFLHDKRAVGYTGKSTDINKQYFDPLILIDTYSKANKKRVVNDMYKMKVITEDVMKSIMDDKYLVVGPNAFYWYITDTYSFIDYKWNHTKTERLL